MNKTMHVMGLSLVSLMLTGLLGGCDNAGPGGGDSAANDGDNAAAVATDAKAPDPNQAAAAPGVVADRESLTGLVFPKQLAGFTRGDYRPTTSPAGVRFVYKSEGGSNVVVYIYADESARKFGQERVDAMRTQVAMEQTRINADKQTGLYSSVTPLGDDPIALEHAPDIPVFLTSTMALDSDRRGLRVNYLFMGATKGHFVKVTSSCAADDQASHEAAVGPLIMALSAIVAP